MFRAEFVDLLRLPDALEQQLGAQRLGHLAQLAVGADFRALEDAVRQTEFAEHGFHPLPKLDLREQIGGQCHLPVGRCGAGVSDGHGAEKKFPILAQRHFPG